MPTSSGARSVRSAAFSVSAVGLSLGAHVTAGGEVPVVPHLLLLVVLVEAASAGFARRPRGPVATALALLTAQAALHGAFLVATSGHGAVDHLPSPLMLAAHGVAALVLAVLLSHGERLIAHAARALTPVALLRPFRPLRVVSRVVATAARDVAPPRLAATLHDLSRRGPPRIVPATRT